MVSHPEIDALEARRLLSAGDLDPTFGKDGIVTKAFGGDVQHPYVAVQSDNKIVVAMTVVPAAPDQRKFALARFTPSGSFDKTFGKSGKVVMSLADPNDLI